MKYPLPPEVTVIPTTKPLTTAASPVAWLDSAWAEMDWKADKIEIAATMSPIGNRGYDDSLLVEEEFPGGGCILTIRIA